MINKKRLLDLFLEYVQIDSESFNEKNMADRLIADLKALGLTVTTDKAGEAIGSNGYNVYATLEGDNSLEPLLFSAHMDTVKPGIGVKPVIKDGVIYSDGTTVLGSDDKSGVAGVIEALTVLKETGERHRPIEVCFSLCEEQGMKGAKNIDYDRIKSRYAVILDSSGDIGKIVLSAPSQVKIRATVVGRASHAGLAPEKGISAVQVASEAISHMKLLRIDEETTANIGTLSVVGATNIVPERIYMEAEVRSRNMDKLHAQVDHMVKCLNDACEKFGATLECETPLNYSCFSVPEDHELVKLVADKTKAMGLPVTMTAGGGGSDANVYSQHGITSVILATGMTNVHTTKECITIKNLEDGAQQCLELMRP